MRAQPLIAVQDVEASTRWYQRLLGCESTHGGTEYERLTADNEVILQIHDWGTDDDHANLGDPNAGNNGNGVLLWFEIDDFDDAITRVEELQAEIVLKPHRNPARGDPGGPANRQCWIRDLDGYTVVLASPDGEAWSTET